MKHKKTVANIFQWMSIVTSILKAHKLYKIYAWVVSFDFPMLTKNVYFNP